MGRSQGALGKAADVSRQTIIAMEQGNYLRSIDLALRVAGAPIDIETLWG